MDWEQLFDSMSAPDDRNRNREKATNESIRQRAHCVHLFFHCPIHCLLGS